MQHHRTMRDVVRANVLELEALGEIEVELHRRTLPLAPDRVDELEVELGPVKRAAALVDRERLAARVQHVRERLRPRDPTSRREPSALSGRVASSMVYG